jgi:hypothetical protein
MNDKYDTLIDRALASYTPAEPRPGLEQRILTSVAAASHAHTAGWRPVWTLAAATALVAVVAIPLVVKFTNPTIIANHPASVAPPSIAVARQFPQAAAAPASSARHTLAVHLRPAATEPAVPETAAQSSPGLIASLTITPIRNQPLTDQAIEFKPLSIAPIRIAALN